MKNTLEKLRKMFLNRRRHDDLSSKFSRSLSFRKASMRRSLRRMTRRKAVVTNQGIVYVEGDSGPSKLPEPAIPSPSDTVKADGRSAPGFDTDGAAATSVTQDTVANTACVSPKDGEVVLRRHRRENRGLVVSSPPGDEAAPARTECRVQSGLIGGVAEIFSQAQLTSGCVAYAGEIHKSPSVDRRIVWASRERVTSSEQSEENSEKTIPKLVLERTDDAPKHSFQITRDISEISAPVEMSIGSERVVTDAEGGVTSKRVLYYADFELIDDPETIDQDTHLSDQKSSHQMYITSERNLPESAVKDTSEIVRQRRDTDGDSGKASSSTSGSLDRAFTTKQKTDCQPKSFDMIPPEELHLLEEMLSNLTTFSSEQVKQNNEICKAHQLSTSPSAHLQNALIRELEAKLASSSFSGRPEHESVSNAHNSVNVSREPLEQGGVPGVRRKPPTVVATRDHLRRSWRRLSNHRRKKTSASRAPDPNALQAQDFYRLYSQASPVPTTSTTSSPGMVVGPSNPFVFSRQNPVTQWLAESEAEARRSSSASHNSDVNLLWSELVMTSSESVAATAPTGNDSLAGGGRRRSKRAPKRGGRLRRSGHRTVAGKNTKSLVKTTTDVFTFVTSQSNPTLASDTSV